MVMVVVCFLAAESFKKKKERKIWTEYTNISGTTAVGVFGGGGDGPSSEISKTPTVV